MYNEFYIAYPLTQHFQIWTKMHPIQKYQQSPIQLFQWKEPSLFKTVETVDRPKKEKKTRM